jgi:uncharacterized cupin superfamily protein
VLSFPRGQAGAHQVANWGDVTARFLAVSTSDAPDLVVYPDSRKLGAFERLPDRGGLSELESAGGRGSGSSWERVGRDTPTRP